MNVKDWAVRYGNWAVIAGGSEGIGLAFARRLAENGINLVLLARTKTTLEGAAEVLRSETGVEVETHALDLTSPDIAERLNSIAAGRDFGTLIYNAGAVHGAGLFGDAPLDRALHLIRLNCIGPATFVHHLAPGMRTRRSGAIILVSSMSGLAGAGYVAAYAASKAYEISFAESLWAELGAEGIDTLALIAGATRTPSMERSGLKFAPNEDSRSGQLEVVAMDPQEVADEAIAVLGQIPTLIAGEKNRASAQWLRTAPREEVIAAMTAAGANMYGLPLLTRS